MKFEKVDYIPRSVKQKRTEKKNVTEMLDNFMEMNTKYVKVILEDGDYSLPWYGRVSLRQCVSRGDYPISVKLVNENIYLVRTDI